MSTEPKTILQLLDPSVDGVNWEQEPDPPVDGANWNVDRDDHLDEVNTSSFQGGDQQVVTTRKTYIDLYYNTKKKSFHYIRSGQLLRKWKRSKPVFYIYYKQLWNRNRLSLLRALVKHRNVSPYAYLDVVAKNTFQLFFVSADGNRKKMIADLNTRTITITTIKKP